MVHAEVPMRIFGLGRLQTTFDHVRIESSLWGYDMDIIGGP